MLYNHRRHHHHRREPQLFIQVFTLKAHTMYYFHLPTTAILTFLLILFSSSAAATTSHHRRLLHQPLFPFDPPVTSTAISQPPFPAPTPQPQPLQPKYPFSTLPPPDSTTPQNPFFPSYPSPPPPPPPPLSSSSSASTFATFPANISSLVLPSSHHTSHKPVKLISLIVSLSLLSIFVFASLLLLRHRHSHSRLLHVKTDSLRLFPPDTPTSDTLDAPSKKPPPPLHPLHTPTSTSSEFLYLGTLVSSREPPPHSLQNDTKAPPPSPPPPTTLHYHRLGSPELHPLPPLPRQHSGQMYNNNPHASSPPPENQDYDDEEFFSPRGSTANNASPHHTRLSPKKANEFNKSRSLNSLHCNSPLYSISPDINSPSVAPNSASPQSMQSKSPDSLVSFPGPLRRFIPPPARAIPAFSPFSPSSTEDGGTTRDCSPRTSDFSGVGRAPPAPPPPPSHSAANGPPELVAPARNDSLGNLEENLKPKLKPLHWDKVRASSDRAMVWDQLKTSSFQLNEEMIETLFMVNSNVNGKDGARRQLIQEANQENIVLDPKKSQNIAILLRALNVTVDEVCEALVEGNADSLGTELLESLLKMAPTKEEERKLKEFKDKSPFKLGTAEAFLKAVLDIPFAFKRVDALRYMVSFESEVEHLKRSFDTLESACKELKSSRIFRKLLEAVLKTGNRMNIGTNRGDARAFKLDTLLKLVDVKGADGKTTLLHFVVQEIIRAEGARLSGVDQNAMDMSPTLQDEVEYRKLGLQVVSGLSGELMNVKKAAAMDSDVLSKDVANLAAGISKITEVLQLNEQPPLNECSQKFFDCVNEFLKKSETEIMNIQAQEGIALSMVKGLTEYFHGDSAKEEARPLRLFLVVRDFLSTLDRVCKDVCKINERAMMNSSRPTLIPVASNLPQVFPGFDERPQSSSSSDESSFSS